jgi:hypothetical protein
MTYFSAGQVLGHYLSVNALNHIEHKIKLSAAFRVVMTLVVHHIRRISTHKYVEKVF